MKFLVSALVTCLFLEVGVASGASGSAAAAYASTGASDGPILEGLSALHQGRFSEGQARFRAFLAADPADPRGHLFLAFSEWWKLLQYSDPGESPVLESHLQEAIRLSQERVKQVSGDSASLATLGTAYIFLAQYRAAQDKVFRAAAAAKKGKGYLEKALNSDPSLVDPRFGLGAYNYYADKVNLLVKGLRSLLFLPGGDSELGLSQLREVSVKGRYFPTEAHLLLAVIYQSRREQRYLKAMDHLQKALRLNPGSPVLLGTIGEFQIRLGRYPEAQATLRRCVEICRDSRDPDQMELARLSRILLADSLDLSLHSAEALREIEAALEHGGDLQPEMRRRALAVAARAAGRLGETARLQRIYQTLGVTEEERLALEQRYGTSPREANVFRVLEPALKLLEVGEVGEARRALEGLRSRYPYSPQVRFHLARACFEEGSWPEAERLFRRVQDPAEEGSRAWIRGWRDLYLGRTLEMTGRREEAVELYRRASDLEGFRGKDLAHALLGPEGTDPRVWPRKVFASGLKDLQYAGDVQTSLPVGRNAP